MENKIKELEKMGHNINGIILGTSNPIVLTSFYRIHKNQDIVIPIWTEESIIRFSNRIYNIVKKYHIVDNVKEE